ncbi:GntR family transcriptional regulator [Streptomyces griseoflavus]|uniref:GntR family transcriptional regulator n=1 Tax=Streptomyces rimosus TaxID=1927 RepID=UPI0004C967D3|nr:GntR family transcriptional regulator [Streptomyces rimosus]KOG53152.1 GntR family transcriptional regulator [Streptomyces griseoflavus]
MTDRAHPRKSRYQEIADELRAEIEAGVYDGGTRLPSEAGLMERFGAARGTVRDAIAVLQAEDLTEAKKGSGVYLRTFERIRRDAAQRLAKSNWGAGRAIWDSDLKGRSRREEVEVDEVEAPEHIAGAFGMPPGGRVWRRSRLHRAEGRPVQQSTSYLPADLVRGTAITRPDTGAGGTYARLADIGHAPARFREEIRARLPLSHEAKVLGITMSTPVMLIARTAFDMEGQPVEVNEMMLDSNSYVLEYNFTS